MIKHLRPTIVRKIWGGHKLESMKGLGTSSDAGLMPVGETLEINEAHLSYLAKFIDTSDELSIQVHPGDEYARIHENSLGKTECWIILEAAPGAGIYLGLKPYVTKALLKSALLEKRSINELLNFYPVKSGDFFYVTSGSIHAIGKDISLAEVQQNSGITYRVWDWNREGRELHIEKSLDVINFDPTCNSLEFFRKKENLFHAPGQAELCNHPGFHLHLLNMKKGEKVVIDLSQEGRPASILNLNGEVLINGEKTKSYDAVLLEGELRVEILAVQDGSLLLIK